MPRPNKYPFHLLHTGDVVNIPCETTKDRTRVRSAASQHGRVNKCHMQVKSRPDGSVDVWCLSWLNPVLHTKDETNWFISVPENGYRAYPVKGKHKRVVDAHLRKLRAMTTHLRDIRGWNFTVQVVMRDGVRMFCFWRLPNTPMYLAGLGK